MARWLLVHPPLLGPAILQPLAAELRRRGHSVQVPDLRAAVATAPGWPERWTAAAATGPADVVLGFSGAGVTLPAVAVAGAARRVVWVDALMPARSGVTAPDEEIRSLVTPLIRGGRIADWTTWWGPDALDELIPDARLRAAVRAEGHELPADFYDVPVPVPTAWPEGGARYVQLSLAYDGAAEEARSRGWPVTGTGTGAHLDVASDPGRVADLLG
ncbi:hypothetical protein [Blastococcus deserti]|uniref:Alpha/beta hydrolase family protein n=1 Tax=Blastococcus deserti TaxID=2259033 RepID=A0ABW4XAI2_9ACTN